MSSPLIARLQFHAGDPVDASLRDELGGQLNEAFVRGDLDADTYRGLLSRLYDAPTLGQLVPVAEALPRTATYGEPAIVVQDDRAGVLEPAARVRGAAWLIVSLGGLAVILVVVAALLVL